jgi:hypothetical protein
MWRPGPRRGVGDGARVHAQPTGRGARARHAQPRRAASRAVARRRRPLVDAGARVDAARRGGREGAAGQAAAADRVRRGGAQVGGQPRGREAARARAGPAVHAGRVRARAPGQELPAQHAAGAADGAGGSARSLFAGAAALAAARGPGVRARRQNGLAAAPCLPRSPSSAPPHDPPTSPHGRPRAAPRRTCPRASRCPPRSTRARAGCGCGACRSP